MKGLYDIFKCVFLRCLREFEMWSLIEKMRKNEEKMRKKLAPESPIIHYSRVMKFHGWIDLIKGKCSAQES